MEINIPNATQRYKAMELFSKRLQTYGEKIKNAHHISTGNLGDNGGNDEGTIFKEIISKDFPNIRNPPKSQIE